MSIQAAEATEQKLFNLIGSTWNDLCEELENSAWDGNDSSGKAEGETGSFYISDTHKDDAVNITFTGSLWVNGVEYAFEAQSGNWNGFRFVFLDPSKPIPEINKQPVLYVLFPTNISRMTGTPKKNKAFLSAYKQLSERQDFKKIASDYMYDRHFAPGSKTENHYRKKAASHGMRIALASEVGEILAQLGVQS